jgi:DNA-binding GntR family transcriptional regulator
MGRLHKFEQVVKFIEEQILNGTWPPGHRLPSVKEWQELGVKYGVLHKVMAMLKARGIVYGVQGVATYTTPQAFDILTKGDEFEGQPKELLGNTYLPHTLYINGRRYIAVDDDGNPLTGRIIGV